MGDAILGSYAILAPYLAGTPTDLFYGGFPGIAVAAAAVRGRRWGWAVAGALSAVTLARFEVTDLSDVLSRLSQLVTYLMLAGIIGWAVHVIYQTDAARRLAEDAEARAEEKSRVAASPTTRAANTGADSTRIRDPTLSSDGNVARTRVADWLSAPPASNAGWPMRSVAWRPSSRFVRVKVDVVAVGSVVASCAEALGRPPARHVNAAHTRGGDFSVRKADEKALRLFVRDRCVGFRSDAVAPTCGDCRSIARRWLSPEF